MKTYQLERFEGDYAIFVDTEDFSILPVSKPDLPKGAKELDIIEFDNEKFIINYEKTEKIKKQTQALFTNLISK